MFFLRSYMQLWRKPTQSMKFQANKCAVWTKLVRLRGCFSLRILIIYLELDWTTPVFLYLRIALRSPQIFCQSSHINYFHTVFLLDTTDVLTCETYGSLFLRLSKKMQLYFSQFGLFFSHLWVNVSQFWLFLRIEWFKHYEM